MTSDNTQDLMWGGDKDFALWTLTIRGTSWSKKLQCVTEQMEIQGHGSNCSFLNIREWRKVNNLHFSKDPVKNPSQWKQNKVPLKERSLPPDDTLGQSSQGSRQFVSDVMGKVLDPSTKRHDHEAMLRCVVHPCLKVLWKHQRQTMRALKQSWRSLVI